MKTLKAKRAIWAQAPIVKAQAAAAFRFAATLAMPEQRIGICSIMLASLAKYRIAAAGIREFRAIAQQLEKDVESDESRYQAIRRARLEVTRKGEPLER